MSSLILEKVLVIGAGTMGSGIAQWLSQQGCKTTLVDINKELCESSLSKIHLSWKKLQDKGKFTNEQIDSFKNNLSISHLNDEIEEPTLVIEAIVENLNIKRELFDNLDRRFSKDTIFASNTSSLPIELLAEKLPEDRKKKFLGLHFFNPATIMKLVEVIKSKWTDDDIVKNLAIWFDERGKKSAKCADRPGFIVNRVARNFYGEALRIVSKYDQDKIHEVDEVLSEVGGFRMGPFKLMDLIGIDINLDVTHSVWNAFEKNPRFAPHTLQEEMVVKGYLGKKTKRGFYEYEG